MARIDELEAKVKTLNAGTGPLSTIDTGTASDRDKKAAPKTAEPSEAYRQAKTDFDKGNFDLALAGFQNYIAQFPDTSLAAGAQYWIGECYASKKEYSKAIEAFQPGHQVLSQERQGPRGQAQDRPDLPEREEPRQGQGIPQRRHEGTSRDHRGADRKGPVA